MKKLSIIAISLTILFLMGCQKITTPSTEIPQRITGDIQTGTIEEITGAIEEITGAIETGTIETGFIIQSFKDCLNAGFPIMESYPRQCNDGITTYVEDLPENNSITGNTIEQETGTNLTVLQQKLKAMMERRKQQETTGTTVPTTSTTENEQVTEEDIENLEKIINEIVQQ